VKHDAHDEAHEMIASGSDLSRAQSAWLQTHLAECETCRRYGEELNQLVRSLRLLPVTADSRLVRATQMRVRFHAGRLREMRERMWLIGIACIGVGLSTAISAPLAWRLFSWMGEWSGLSTLVWQTGFLSFFVAPLVVVTVLLRARSRHLSNHEEKQWK
jgi:hypothetical protein